MRKLTQEEVIRRCNEIHNFKYDYTKTIFKNTRTPFIVTCPIHGDFTITPKNHMNGQGCGECGKEYAKMYHKGNYDNFLEIAHKIYGGKYSFPYIKEEYENERSQITYVCEDCNFSDRKRAGVFLRNFAGCPQCRKETKTNTIVGYSREFVEDMLSHTKFSLVSFTTDFKENEITSKDKITFLCPEHGTQTILFSTFLKNIHHLTICKFCRASNIAREQWMTKYDFLLKEKEKFGNKFSYNIDDFIDEVTPITFTCNDCGHTFKRTPRKHLLLQIDSTHTGCKNCSFKKMGEVSMKTTSQFKQDVIKYYGETAFDLTNLIYKGSDQPVTLKCNECGKYFTIEANSLLQGHGCPRHFRNRSKIENEIYEFIKNDLGIECDDNNRKLIDGKELDIYIPSLKIAIELDGLFWHNENNIDKNYHLEKTNKCRNAGIRLIHIFEDEWLYKQDIVKSMLSHILHQANKQVYARKCEVGVVDGANAKQFIEENHIQGYCSSKINLGLYCNNDLVSIMSFGHSRHFAGSGKNDWELLRFCSKLGINVVGAASKLLKYFISLHKPKEIITFADKRWSVGNLYNKLGFTLYNESKPNYYYVIGDRRKYRYNFRKSILVKKYNCPQEVSEHEFCKSKKWYRIYDCGNYCYKMNF